MLLVQSSFCQGLLHFIFVLLFTIMCYIYDVFQLQDRDKLLLTRMVVFELVQALKFKVSLPDNNFLTLINFVLSVSHLTI